MALSTVIQSLSRWNGGYEMLWNESGYGIQSLDLGLYLVGQQNLFLTPIIALKYHWKGHGITSQPSFHGPFNLISVIEKMEWWLWKAACNTAMLAVKLFCFQRNLNSDHELSRQALNQLSLTWWFIAQPYSNIMFKPLIHNISSSQNYCIFKEDLWDNQSLLVCLFVMIVYASYFFFFFFLSRLLKIIRCIFGANLTYSMRIHHIRCVLKYSMRIKHIRGVFNQFVHYFSHISMRFSYVSG